MTALSRSTRSGRFMCSPRSPQQAHRTPGRPEGRFDLVWSVEAARLLEAVVLGRTLVLARDVRVDSEEAAARLHPRADVVAGAELLGHPDGGEPLRDLDDAQPVEREQRRVDEVVSI